MMICINAIEFRLRNPRSTLAFSTINTDNNPKIYMNRGQYLPPKTAECLKTAGFFAMQYCFAPHINP